MVAGDQGAPQQAAHDRIDSVLDDCLVLESPEGLGEAMRSSRSPHPSRVLRMALSAFLFGAFCEPSELHTRQIPRCQHAWSDACLPVFWEAMSAALLLGKKDLSFQRECNRLMKSVWCSMPSSWVFCANPSSFTLQLLCMEGQNCLLAAPYRLV